MTVRIHSFAFILLACAGCVENSKDNDVAAARTVGAAMGALAGSQSGAGGTFDLDAMADNGEWQRSEAAASVQSARDISIKLETGVVRGTAWEFGSDGVVDNYHGQDLGLVLDSKTYFLEVEHKRGTDFVPADIVTVITAAERYCEESGLVVPFPENLGALVVAEGQTLKLVEFCVPEGVVLPSFSQVGDRIPRGPNE